MKSSAWGVLALFMLAADAGAQARDPAAAQALFDDGMALMKSHNYVKACAKLAESQRLDPGIGTQFHLAECYEGQGLTASAWAQFLEVASLAGASGQTDRQQAARKHAAKLEPRLGRIRVTVPAAKRVAGLQVERDGVGIQEVSWDSPLPVDPGEHELTVSAPGYHPFVAKVTVREGQTTEMEVPKLEAVPAAAPPASAAASTAPAPLPSPPAAAPTSPPIEAPAKSAPSPEAPPPSSGMGAGVIALGTVGVVGLGVGTVLGLMAHSKYQDSKSDCSTADENRCNADGVKMRDDSIALANVSTIAFLAGGAALAAAGIVLIAKGGDKPARAQGVNHLVLGAQGGPSRGTLVLRGSF